MPRSYLHMGTLNHYQPWEHLQPLSCVLTLMLLLKLTSWLYYILCRDTAEKLNLLPIGPIHSVNSVGVETTDQDIRDKYRQLFNGVGLLKGYELKLNVDTSVIPVSQSVPRFPFGVREKVEKKLDELLACRIVEEVLEGPASWVSSLVVVPKPDSNVGICVDMRRANQTMIRERQLIPTVKEVLQDLNGSTVFIPVDLESLFHRIRLVECTGRPPSVSGGRC